MNSKDYSKLKAYCKKNGVNEDFLHDALEKVLVKYPEDKITPNLIFVVAKNEMRQHFNKGKKNVTISLEDLDDNIKEELVVDESFSPEEYIQYKNEIDQSIKDRFDESYLTCFRLYMTGTKIKKLAKQVGISYRKFYYRVRQVIVFLEDKHKIDLKCLLRNY